MTSAQPTRPAGFLRRTRLITIVSIVAVGLAGATAVGANVGILSTASDSTVGSASATGDLTTPSTQVVDVYLPTTAPAGASKTTTPPATATGVQDFGVDVAGTVAVASTGSGLRLDHVTPTVGWTWKLSQSNPSALTVTMTDGSRTFEFAATASADGNIAASVTEPIVTPAPATASGGDRHDDQHGDYEGGKDDD